MTLSSILMLIFMMVSCSYKVFVASGSYCLFLISLSLVSSLLLFTTTNSFWYCCLLLLMYIGGVYVLLLFVSMYSYNSYSYSSLVTAMTVSVSFLVLTYNGSLFSYEYDFYSSVGFSLVSDESLSILSGENWVSYLFILLVILLSMFMFSFIFNDNKSYLR